MSLLRFLPRRNASFALRIPLASDTTGIKKNSISVFETDDDEKGIYLIEKNVRKETVTNLCGASDVQFWTQNQLFFHRDQVISGGISTTAFQKLSQMMNTFNKFILPLPKREGSETFQVEGKEGEILFCPLKDVPTDLEFEDEKAIPFPSMILKFFTKAGDPDQVIFRGLVHLDKLTVEEGRYLAKLFLHFYTANDEAAVLMKRFKEKPDIFEIEKVSEMIQKLAIKHPFRF